MLRHVRILAFVLPALAYGVPADAQGTLTLRFQLSIFSNCWGSRSVHVTFVDATDSTHNRRFELRCGLESPPLEATVSIADNIAVVSDWPAAKTWRVSRREGWLTIEGIALEPGHYTFKSVLSGASIPMSETLSEKTLVYNRTNGASLNNLFISRQTFADRIVGGLIVRDTMYATVITALLLTLAGALRRRLQQMMERGLDFLGQYGSGWLAARRFQKLYGDYLRTTHQYLRILGFNAAGVSRPQLEQVFISLRVSPFDRTRASDEKAADPGVSFERAVARFPRLVILGGPGTGKTTTLSYIVLQLLRGRTGELFGTTTPLLPIFVPLRRVSSRDTSMVDDILSPDTQILPVDLIRELPEQFVQQRLARGRCVVLLDGLDEVIDQATHQLIATKINRLVKQYPDNRYIVTCRIAGWRGLLDNFAVLETEDFNRSEVHRFVFGWHRAIITQEYKTQIELDFVNQEERTDAWRKRREEADNAIDESARRLVNAIDGSGRLMSVATNPMLLSLICLVNYVKRVLPRERSVLYEKCVELLVDAWDRTRNIPSAMTISTADKESILRAIALTFQKSGKGEAPRSEVEAIVAGELNRLGLSLPARDLLEQIVQRSGILIERSIDVLGFSHLTLQEYLVAKWIQLNPSELALLHDNLDNQEWREVILLYAGLVDNATNLVARIVANDVPARWLLAGYTLGEAKRADRALTQTILRRLQTEFERTPSPSDVLISVLASLCADFGETPTTPEQELSAQILDHVRNETALAVPAIRVLGRSRVTHAIPSMVALLGSSVPELEEEAARSLVLFGNIALSSLVARVRDDVNGVPVARTIQIFREIGTGHAAKQLIQCYQYWTAPPSHSALSSGLAAMLDDELVATELLDIGHDDLPEVIRAYSIRLEAVTWPFGDRATPAFRRLMVKMRDDIAAAKGARLGDSSEGWESDAAGFRIKFTALVAVLIEHVDIIDRAGWTSLGYEPSSDNDLAVLNRIRRDVKSSRAAICTSIRRVLEARGGESGRTSLMKEMGFWMRLLLRSSEIAIGVMAWLHMSLCAAILYSVVTDGDTSNNQELVIVFFGLTLLIWLVTTTLAIWYSPRGARWKACLGSFTCVLRRLPYYPTGHPWLNFYLVQSVWLAFSIATFFLVVMVMESRLYSVGLVLFSIPALMWLIPNHLFFAFVALRVDAPALLLIRHPAGRRLLGMTSVPSNANPPQSGMATSTVLLAPERG